MFLGIEIGGTKLQLGVGRGDGVLVELVRHDVQAELGAAGILQQIRAATAELAARHKLERVGIGFGGPVDTARGVVVKSHHVAGWDDFPLADWCQQELKLPAAIENDCDTAALAEARFGAGQGHSPVFYVTVGTGIGGGLVVDGELYRGSGRGAAEIGHLRPGLLADRPEATVESLASGTNIAAAARARLAELESGSSPDLTDLLERAGGDAEQLTAKIVAEAAADGNRIAREVLGRACRALGWAIAQTITLVSPEVVVAGGGVSLAGETLFFEPLRAEVARYVFPPLAGKYQIVPAALGEEVVVHGALARASQ